MKKGARSVGLRWAELLSILVGATVFLIGVLTGAGVAAWVMPPV
jgi:hypothetical protein